MENQGWIPNLRAIYKKAILYGKLFSTIKYCKPPSFQTYRVYLIISFIEITHNEFKSCFQTVKALSEVCSNLITRAIEK